MLRSHADIHLKNIRRGELVYARDRKRFTYGLVVLNHVSKPFVAGEVAGGLLEADFPIHVLSLFDFYNLARVLDTPADLIGYFEMRADVLVPTLQPRVHEEKPVFEYYLEHLERS